MLTPVRPYPTGSGLAMRMWLFLQGALTVADVHLVIVPIWGMPTRGAVKLPGLLSVDVVRPSRRRERSVARAWRSDPVGQARYARLAPIYPPVFRVPPSKVSQLASLRRDGIDAVLSMQLGTTTLGLTLAEALGVPLLVDLCDDDERFLRDTGQQADAAAVGRLAAEVLPRAALVTTPNAAEAMSIAARHGLGDRALWVPNAVRLPERAFPAPPGAGRILFVGTFDYEPNVRAAQWLVREVSPRISRPHEIELVGGGGGAAVRGLASSRVRIRGQVPDLWPHYRDADVVVAPLAAGSGTRIKVLEAFAHQRPVVATRKAAEGIAVEDGRHLYLADSAQGFAHAVTEVLDGGAPPTMIESAYALVSDDHEAQTTAARIGDLLRQAVGRGGARFVHR